MGERERSPLGRVTVYSIQGCPHCMQAKATLGTLGIPVFEVDVGKHPELRARVKELTGRSTVPQIFFNSVHVGGNDDLQKMVRKSSAGSRNYVRVQFRKLFEFECVCVSSCTQAPEERQRLVKLVQEEPLPADAPPLPEENQSDDSTGDTDGGEK